MEMLLYSFFIYKLIVLLWYLFIFLPVFLSSNQLCHSVRPSVDLSLTLIAIALIICKKCLKILMVIYLFILPPAPSSKLIFWLFFWLSIFLPVCIGLYVYLCFIESVSLYQDKGILRGKRMDFYMIGLSNA